MLNVKPIFKSCWSNNYPAVGVGKYLRKHFTYTDTPPIKKKFLLQKNLMDYQPVFNLESTSNSVVHLSLYLSLLIWDPILPYHRLGTPWVAVKSLFFKPALDSNSSLIGTDRSIQATTYFQIWVTLYSLYHHHFFHRHVCVAMNVSPYHSISLFWIF